MKKIFTICLQTMGMLCILSSASMSDIHLDYLTFSINNWGVNFFDLWTYGSFPVTAVGRDGKIGNFSYPIQSPVQEDLYGIWGPARSEMFAVGANGTILHLNGIIDPYKWELMESGTEENLYGIWGDSSGAVFAVGGNGTILFYDGTAWTAMENESQNALYGIWGVSSDNVYAVGANNTILHYNGVRWSSVSAGLQRSYKLFDISGSSATDIYVVGGSYILHYDGTAWSEFYYHPPGFLYSVWCGTENEVVAAGYGYILHYDGMSWHRAVIETGDDLYRAVWGDAMSNVFVATRNGYLFYLKFSGDDLIQLTDSFGNGFYLDKIGSTEDGLLSYHGKCFYNQGIYDCEFLYNPSDEAFTLTIDYKEKGKEIANYVKAESPKLYNCTYSALDGHVLDISPDNPPYMIVKSGEFPTAPSAKTASSQAARISNEKTAGTQQIENTLKLGALIPLSGDLQSLGEEYAAALHLAEEDLQAYLDSIGSGLNVELYIEDNKANPEQTWLRVQALREQGISVFLGPQDSSSLDYIKQFADEENYLMLSSSSTAAQLSIPDDNVMRCISDDGLQASALIDKMQADGIENIVIVSQNNIYGRGLYQSIERGWNESNDYSDLHLDDPFGDISDDWKFATTIPFTRPLIDIPDALADLQTILANEIFADKNKSAVVLIAYDEGAELMQQAAEIPGLAGLRWYGTDSLAQNTAITANPAAAGFAAQTLFTCTEFAAPESEAYTSALEQIKGTIGYIPPTTAMLIYDSYQLAVRAYLQAGTDDPQSIKAALQAVAESWQGITGNLRFNQNGDRASGAYQYWTLKSGNGNPYWQSDSSEVWQPTLVSDWMIME